MSNSNFWCKHPAALNTTAAGCLFTLTAGESSGRKTY
jgi:hypothetical protein